MSQVRSFFHYNAHILVCARNSIEKLTEFAGILGMDPVAGSFNITGVAPQARIYSEYMRNR
jgi:hypothetical protein